MLADRQPYATVGRAVQTDQCGLIPQPDGVAHPTKSHPRMGAAGVGNGSTGQIAIIDQHTVLSQCQHHLPVDERTADPLQSRLHRGDRLFVTSFQGPADATVVGPTWLIPRLSHSLVLIQGVGAVADVL